MRMAWFIRTGRVLIGSSVLALVFVVSGCGDESRETGTVAPGMTPEEELEMEQSMESYMQDPNM